MAKVLGTLGTIDTLTVGGRVMTDVSSNLIILVAACGTAAHYSTFRQTYPTASSSGYTVPAGKTLTVVALRMTPTGAAQQVTMVINGTTDVGFDSASAPTSGTPLGGNNSAWTITNPTASSLSEVGTLVQFAQNTLPAAIFTVTAQTVIWAFGYLS